jgi:hypothetical protein
MLKHAQIKPQAEVYWFDYDKDEVVKGFIQDPGEEFHLVGGLEPEEYYGFYKIKATEALYATREDVIDAVIKDSIQKCKKCINEIDYNNSCLSRATARLAKVSQLRETIIATGDNGNGSHNS